MPTITINSDTSLQDAQGIIRELYLTHRYLKVNIKTGKDRSTDQNSLLWPLLQDLSNQVNWYGQKLTPDEWKDVMTAGLKRSKIVPGMDGGFVIVGGSTSKMDKKTFSELLELIMAFGTQQGVKFTSDRKDEV